MKAVIQRVTKASVSVDGELINTIGKGLCVLIGIARDDTPKDIDFLVRKILNLKVFECSSKRWSRSVMDEGLEVLCVSQFTLCSILKGNKLDFHTAMDGDKSYLVYQELLQRLKSQYDPEKVKDGRFAAYMQVSIENDGPVTIQLESPRG